MLFLTTLVSCKLHCSTDPPAPRLGDLVRLYCKKEINTDNESFRLVWKSSRTQAIATENYDLTKGQTAKLLGEITLMEEDNYQQFTCKERRDQQTPNMCEIIPLKIPSEVIVTATLQPTYETANVTFSCESNMIPKVKRYSWSFDGKPVHDGGRFRIVGGGKTLVVLKAMLEDHKKIATCTSFNGLGLNKSGSNIIMIDPNMTPPSTIKSDKDLFILGIGAGFASMAILVVLFCIIVTIVKKGRVRKDSEILTSSEKDEETTLQSVDCQQTPRCNPYASSDLAVTTSSLSARCMEKERELELEAECDKERRYFTLEKPQNVDGCKHESLYASIDEDRL